MALPKLQIAPQDCEILRAISATRSIREASRVIGCDPSGLARKLNQISSESNFLRKDGNRWKVTPAGMHMIAWLEDAIKSQHAFLNSYQSIRIASTPWLTERILIPKYNELMKQFPKETRFSFVTPDGNFEEELTQSRVEFVIVCHPPETPEIEHLRLANEKWVVVTANDPKKKYENASGVIAQLPLVEHSGMNIANFLDPQTAQLIPNSRLSIDNFLGIRRAVIAGLGWAIVPHLLVQNDIRNKLLVELDIGIQDRKVCLWWLRNRSQNKRLSSKLATWIRGIDIR